MLTSYENIETGITDKLEKLIPGFLLSIKKYDIENPVKSKRIEDSLKISGTEVRAIVSHLRMKKFPIGSNGRGYYFARNYTEIEPTIKHLEERKMKLDALIGVLKSSFKKTEQESLFAK